MKFKVGDIVKQINWYHTVPSIISGEIVNINESCNSYTVKWDEDGRESNIKEEYIELVSDSYKEWRLKRNEKFR